MLEKLKISKPPSFFLPEILATFGYIFYTCLCPDFGPYLAGLNTGMTVYFLVVVNHTIAPVHFNPALTICFLVTGKLKWSEFFWYLLAQILGGVAASGVVYGLYQLSLETEFISDDNNSNMDMVTIINSYALDVPEKANWGAVLISEIITSSMMCLLAAMTIYNRNTWAESTGILSIGVIVWMGIITGQKVGAGCLNPIRSMMPWSISGVLFFKKVAVENWTYTVGPLLGGILGALLYGLLYCEDESVNFRKGSRKAMRKVSRIFE